MNTVRSLALVAFVEAGVAAEVINNGTPQGEVVGVLPKVARDDTCVGLPKLCTGAAMMHDYATTLTYFCPETTTTTHVPSTVHITITKTITVTPPEVEATEAPTNHPSMVAPAPALTKEPDTTATIHSTLTEYKTITLVGNKDGPPTSNVVSAPAIVITDYVSATMPTELSSEFNRFSTETGEPVYTVQTSIPPATSIPDSEFATETEEPVYTIQTSIPAVTSTSDSDFPTMSPPVVNGTTTGIFYTGPPMANSSVAHPTAFFPNATSTHSHYALPTLNVANRAAEETKAVKGAASKCVASLLTLVLGGVAVAFI